MSLLYVHGVSLPDICTLGSLSLDDFPGGPSNEIKLWRPPFDFLQPLAVLVLYFNYTLPCDVTANPRWVSGPRSRS